MRRPQILIDSDDRFPFCSCEAENILNSCFGDCAFTTGPQGNTSLFFQNNVKDKGEGEKMKEVGANQS